MWSDGGKDTEWGREEWVAMATSRDSTFHVVAQGARKYFNSLSS